MNETVLVVDDEERIRSSLRGILSDEGFRVVDTGNAPGVMDLIARESPAIVLLDVWMPEMDGIELLRRIKSEQPRVPGDHDLGPRQHPERSCCDQAGRRGFYSEAIFGKRIARIDRTRARGRLRRPGSIQRARHERRGPRRRPQSNSRRRDPAANCRAVDRDGRAGASHRPQNRRHPSSRARQDSESCSPRWPTRPRFPSASRTSPTPDTTPRSPAAAARSAPWNICCPRSTRSASPTC